jgi:hypothetical protein
LSRRRLTALLACLPFSAFAQDPVPPESDGEGPVLPLPKEKRPRDRGIGGTGVIGTIRQFGSIIVNDLRIAYPHDVAVVIDGIPKPATAMRIGHVVEVVAQGPENDLSTGRIVITSEVIGPVETVSPTMITVLGQSILADGVLPETVLRPGDMIAVSGLRRLDGTIVASRIERRRGSHMQVAGRLKLGPDGALRLGRLVVDGARHSLVGQRVLVTGTLAAGVFKVTGTRAALTLLRDPSLHHVSMEAYGKRLGSEVMFGSGLQLAGTSMQIDIPEGREVRMFAEILRGVGGGLGIGTTRVAEPRPRNSGGPPPNRSNRPPGPPGQAPSSAPGGRPQGSPAAPPGPSGAPPGAPQEN